MKKTTYIFDNIVLATQELEDLLNEGYEVVAANIFSMGAKDDYEQLLSAVLVKEV